MVKTRRGYIAALSGLTATSIAGCMGDDNPDVKQVESLPTPFLGDEDAPVTVMVFEDFRCSYCKSFNEEIAPMLINEYVESGEIQYQHHDYPILGQESVIAANSARAVQNETDNETFWNYSQLIYENQNSIGSNLYEEAANQVGATGETVSEEAANLKYQPVIEADTDLGESLSVNGTPTVVVEGEKVEPGQNYGQSIALAIEDNL